MVKKRLKFNWEKFWSREILAPECDELCRFRSCYHPSENKGSFSPGRGYTKYFDNPEPICATRYLHGCPHDHNTRPLPDTDKIIDWAYINKKSQMNIIKALINLIIKQRKSK